MADKKWSAYDAKVAELTDYICGLDYSGTPVNKRFLISSLKTLLQANVQLDVSALPSYAPGQISYDPDSKTVVSDTGVSGVRIQIGQEIGYLVINNTGVQIDNGAVCYASGVDATSELMEISLADASTAQTASAVLGLATSDIADGAIGIVTNFGVVRDFDTNSLTVGTPVYLSETAGELTNTKPTAPARVVLMGTCLVKNATTGKVQVSVNRVDRPLAVKSYSFTSNGIGFGTYYIGGFYDSPATDTTLTNASKTQTYGTATKAYCAHSFAVFGGAGTVDTGVVGLRVNGTSITDAGVRTTSDSEVVTADITGVSTDEYIETAKKFVGQVTYELYTVSGTPTSYTLDFNYGYAKYEDFGNSDFSIASLETVGLAGANDTAFDIQLLHHKATGWTYSATAFEPGNGLIVGMKDTLSTDSQLSSGENFAFKRTSIGQFVDGNGSEGTVIKVIVGSNNSVQSMDTHMGIFVEDF
jgi:hypothetical protein